jgi:hypothetical protein
MPVLAPNFQAHSAQPDVPFLVTCEQSFCTLFFLPRVKYNMPAHGTIFFLNCKTSASTLSFLQVHRFSPLFVIHLISLRRLKRFNEHTSAPVNALHLRSHDIKKKQVVPPVASTLFPPSACTHTHTHTRALHGPLRSPNRHGPSLFSSHQVKSGRLMILITCEPLFSIHQQLRAFALSFF